MSKNISLVLSGGGARGIAHIGVINVLQENGFTINAIAGTSMGAMVGGVFASGTLPNFQKWLEDADLKEAMKILDFSFSNPGFI
ncbi:MAG TPA: alpha/beta hydrolase, partial [Flavobacteriia bacterium]|nr:alpha/beta hydrolase [Flavobacteriia bacterium]